MSVLGIITLFMLFVPMMKDSAMKVFIYYTPCQLFSFLVGSYGINRLKIHPEYYNDDKLLRSQFHKAFLWTAIFSVLIIIEDWIVIFHFDNYGEQNIHITNRSYTENLMSIYYVFTTLRILAPYVQSLLGSSNAVPSSAADLKLQSVQTSDTPLEPPADIPPEGSLTDIQELPSDTVYVNPDTFNERLPEADNSSDQADYSKFYLFSRDYQLTPREQHILQLLLENKTNVEIGDDLCISIGTAKAHVHNIFAKVDVKKRQQLLDVYEHYIPSDTRTENL